MDDAAISSGHAERNEAAALVVLTGNPNCGKTTVFNALTGLRAKVGNYAGVTVERKEGRLLGVPRDSRITILDLPGTYSLSPRSLDEQIVRDVLFHRLADVAVPDLVVAVVDASNLERNLYFASQVIELGYPSIVVLNMIDAAADNGQKVAADQLSRILEIPVVPTVANRGEGIAELREAILSRLAHRNGSRRTVSFCELPDIFHKEIAGITALLNRGRPSRMPEPQAESLLILSDDKALPPDLAGYPDTIRDAIGKARTRLESTGIAWRSAAVEGRYARVAAIRSAVTTQAAASKESFSDQLDRILTHKIWGPVIFVLIMAAMFQSIFSLARFPMNALDAGVTLLGQMVARLIPPGDFHSLMVNGVIAGVGAVVVFLPQICLLFLFIGLLEDTGYMTRAAFLMDRWMSKVGLHGKSFIPMLSSFACAIPGIMATRTIENHKDRLATILVAPLISCSARLPVYTLLIAACIPNGRVLGYLKLQGLVLFAMYCIGIVMALFMAWVFKKTLLRGDPPMLILEMPPYRRPALKAIFNQMWGRAQMFLKRAGTVILGINILLWFLSTYPHDASRAKRYAAEREAIVTHLAAAANNGPEVETTRVAAVTGIDRREAAEQLQHSFAGRLGHLIAPIIAPLGWDWKIGIGIVTSFAAREVFVSTMSTVYSVGGDGPNAATTSLAQTLRQQRRPDGSLLFTPLIAISLMVFYIFAMQCASTVVVVRRETNSWKWPLFQWAYMGVLAWGLAFLTYQGGRLLGWH